MVHCTVLYMVLHVKLETLVVFTDTDLDMMRVVHELRFELLTAWLIPCIPAVSQKLEDMLFTCFDLHMR